jgi:mycofactocin system transcriptional regulator
VRTGARAVLARSGRPAVTSRAELEQVALELFAARGFEATTVDDIAAAAGIGRRTFFRYYSSKNDVVWGEFEEGLSALRRHLAGAPRSQPLPDALREAVLAFNRLDPVHEPWHRDRMVLVLGVPALQAHGTLRYAAWREVVAEFVGERLALPADALLPRLVAHLCLGAALSAYEQWLREPGTDLGQLLDRCLRALDGSWALDGAWALPDGAAGGERPDPAR